MFKRFISDSRYLPWSLRLLCGDEITREEKVSFAQVVINQCSHIDAFAAWAAGYRAAAAPKRSGGNWPERQSVLLRWTQRCAGLQQKNDS